MKIIIILCRFFIFSLLFLYSFACSYPTKNQNFAQVPNGFQGSYLVLKDGVILDSKGLGLANNASREKNDLDTLFRVGSISKPITAIAIAKFLERGQLRIGQKISEIPNLNWQGDVTIRDLLKHTSGIANVENPRYANSFKNVTDADDLHARILSMRSFGKSGSAYSYSSTNFLLLGIIVEKLSGSYRDFVKKTVFDPAGAIRSGFDFPFGPLGEGYAAPEGNPNGPRESNNFPFSAGAFVTSINELLKIDQAMKQGKIIDVRNLSNLMRNNMGFMQFGAMYFHPGVIDSYHAAWFTSLPEESNHAIFVFSNSRKSRMVSREIAQQLKAQYGL